MTGTSGSRTGHAHGLIADHEPAPDEARLLAATKAGGRPYPAPDGRNALRTVRGWAPRAVVLDGTLPDLGGLRGPLRRAGPGHGRTEESVRVLGDPASVIHAVRGLGYVIRAVEDGR
ncbi:hypothetical protein ABZT06_04605 [Streptomyces sp. NPDC005483]|uniref:hypothetical protein n=1 Tax=Streptomyces sp. NPDC005483 TaxID=3154882 RepID=UPI0033B33008